jgi:hypothetical protein
VACTVDCRKEVEHPRVTGNLQPDETQDQEDKAWIIALPVPFCQPSYQSGADTMLDAPMADTTLAASSDQGLCRWHAEQCGAL